MPLHISSICAHHQEVKITLHSLWYHQTYRWPSGAQVERGPVHQTATYRFDDTRGCVMQFWPPDDGHMCSKHVEAWNKLIVKQKLCASSWLITVIKTCLMCWTIDRFCSTNHVHLFQNIYIKNSLPVLRLSRCCTGEVWQLFCT